MISDNYKDRATTAGCGTVAPIPIAKEVLERTEGVAAMAQRIAEIVRDRLAPVTVTTKSDIEKSCSQIAKNPREYPPLFAEWSSLVYSIQNSLENIEDTINRTAL